MNIRNLSSLAVIGLGICFSAVTINPVNSSELTDNHSEEIIISQLRGHDNFEGNPQRQWRNYSLGRVVGKSGDIIFIRVEDGTTFRANGYVRPYTYINPGSDVLVSKDDNGKYYLVSASKSEWISRLEEDYGLDRNEIAEVPINRRTAAIWSEIAASNQRDLTVTQILNTQTRQRPPVDPFVRGLW